MADDALARVRTMCLALPETSESGSHGLQETRVEEDPEVFFRSPYVGVRGGLAVGSGAR